MDFGDCCIGLRRCYFGCCTALSAFVISHPLLALALALALGAALPFVLTAAVTVCLVLYFILRFFEFVSGDAIYTEYFSRAGDTLAKITLYFSLMSVFSGWDMWWIIVYKVHALKHHVILEMELLKWVQLFLIYSALCVAMMVPRVIIAMVRVEIDSKSSRVRLIDGIVGVIECVLFVLAELAVMKHAPNWKYHVALGFQTWKLIQVLVLILFGIMVINVTTRVTVRLLGFLCKNSKHVVYFAKGLRKSTNFVFISTLLMAMWISYFNPHFKQAGVGSNRALELVSWTFVCLAIGSVFWLLKKFIVLLWKAHAVYDRFDQKITQAGTQFYILTLLCRETFDNSTARKVLLDNKERECNQSTVQSTGNETSTGKMASSLIRFLRDMINGQSAEGTHHKKQKAKDILLQEQKSRSTLAIYELQRMTKYFQDIDGDLALQKYKKIATQFTTENIDRVLGEDAEVLFRQMHAQAEGTDAEKYEKWVVKAYNNCRELGNTLVGAKEVAIYLNRLLIGFFLLVIIIIWLLVTKIATIQLFVLVTSPLLAASFIFGDFCKSIFQGIIFTFVMHLFDVGDMCIISGTKMEVRKIGIWRTTFRKVDTNEQVIYQNSILTEMVIIKQKGSLDLNDSVEYSLSTATWNQSDFWKLKTKIDEFIKTSIKLQKHPLGVLVKEVGHDIKIVIHFKHKRSDQDMIYFDFNKKRNRSRAQLLVKVKELLES